MNTPLARIGPAATKSGHRTRSHTSAKPESHLGAVRL